MRFKTPFFNAQEQHSDIEQMRELHAANARTKSVLRVMSLLVVCSTCIFIAATTLSLLSAVIVGTIGGLVLERVAASFLMWLFLDHPFLVSLFGREAVETGYTPAVTDLQYRLATGEISKIKCLACHVRLVLGFSSRTVFITLPQDLILTHLPSGEAATEMTVG